jgi:hypothetical protein
MASVTYDIKSAGNFFLGRETVSSSRRARLHGVICGVLE